MNQMTPSEVQAAKVQMTPPINLFKKMAKVMKSIKTVKKTGFNSYQKYSYTTEADLMNAVRDELIKENIFIFTSVEGVEKVGDLTTCKVLNTFIDTDSGESFSVYSFGQGQNNSGKGIYISLTGAYKYMLQKNLMLPSEDDPENDSFNSADKTTPNKTTPTSTTKTFTKQPTTMKSPIREAPAPAQPIKVETVEPNSTKPSFSTMQSDEKIPY